MITTLFVVNNVENRLSKTSTANARDFVQTLAETSGGTIILI
jgi:hypothetical protein